MINFRSLNLFKNKSSDRLLKTFMGCDSMTAFSVIAAPMEPYKLRAVDNVKIESLIKGIERMGDKDPNFIINISVLSIKLEAAFTRQKKIGAPTNSVELDKLREAFKIRIEKYIERNDPALKLDDRLCLVDAINRTLPTQTQNETSKKNFKL